MRSLVSSHNVRYSWETSMKKRMTKEQRAQKIDRAIKLVYDSLYSHTGFTHRKTKEGSHFHQKCVSEYAEVIKILSELY